MKKEHYITIALLLLFVLCFFSISIIKIRKTTVKSIQKETVTKIEGISEKVQISNTKQQYEVNTNCNGEVWYLIIPSLEVKAEIKEGVDPKVLKYYIRTL